MTNHHKFNQEVWQKIAIPDVVSPLEQINTDPGTWYGTTDLENAFFFTPIGKQNQNTLAFMK